ncbi:MAG TPA: hypothetical protein VNU93_08695, partial [Verrucomicrobiae bacterium]|nr:hypothetical protein [Verrucomicrobiae bacterium]
MKRLFAIALILVLSITGCGKAPEPRVTGQPAPPVITLWHSYQGEARKGLEKAGSDLNAANSSFHLELVYIPANEYLTKFNQARVAEKGPDLLIVPADKIPELYTDMAIQPLDKFLDPGPYFKAGLEGLSFNGSLM